MMKNWGMNYQTSAEDLSANAFAASLAASHDALGGGHDRDAEATLDAANLIAAEVDAAAGTGDALAGRG